MIIELQHIHNYALYNPMYKIPVYHPHTDSKNQSMYHL